MVICTAMFLPFVGCAHPRTKPGPTPQQETAAIASPALPDPDAQSTGTLGRLDKSITGGVRQTAAWIDRFLSREQSLAEDNRSWFALRLDTSWDEGKGIDPALRFGARISLPQTEDKLQIFLNANADQDDATSAPPAADPSEDETTDETDASSLGLQSFLKATQRNNIRLRIGARFEDSRPDPYGAARWRHELPLGSWMMRATERLVLLLDAGVESVTTLDFERPVTEALFFRTTTSGTWREEDPDPVARQRFNLFQRLNDSRMLTYEWDNAFVTDSEHALDETALRVRASQRLYHRRILFELAPQIAWRQDFGYEPSYGLLLRIELSFGREE